MTIENQYIARIMLDGTYLYWTVYDQIDTIFRTPLNGDTIEKFVTSKFEGGNIEVMPWVLAGDWFIYLDHDNSGIEANWGLRAKNLQDNSEKIMLSGRGIYAAAFNLFISVSGEWIAWSRLLPNELGTCDESVLGLSNLNTNEQIELDRVCIEQAMWTLVSLSNHILIAEQDLPDAKGGGNNLYLFDIAKKQDTPMLIAANASMPDISSPWIVWKNAPRFDWGLSNSVYNVNDKTQRNFTVPGENPTDPQLTEHWLYWLIEEGSGVDGIYLYDLEKEQAWKIPPPDEGAFSDIAIYGQWIAWSISSDYAGGDSILEWGELP